MHCDTCTCGAAKTSPRGAKRAGASTGPKPEEKMTPAKAAEYRRAAMERCGCAHCAMALDPAGTFESFASRMADTARFTADGWPECRASWVGEVAPAGRRCLEPRARPPGPTSAPCVVAAEKVRRGQWIDTKDGPCRVLRVRPEVCKLNAEKQVVVWYDGGLWEVRLARAAGEPMSAYTPEEGR